MPLPNVGRLQEWMMLGGELFGDGFTKLPNRLGEALATVDFTATQFKIVICLIRLGIGWNRRTVRVSQAELARKCRVNPKTGGWREAFERLLENGVIVEVMPRSGRRPPAYELNTDFRTWGRYSVDLEFLKAQFRGRPESVDHETVAGAHPSPPLDKSVEEKEPQDADRRVTSEGHSTRDDGGRRVTSQGHSTGLMVPSEGTETSRTRNPQVPPEAPQGQPKSAPANEIGPPKAIESQEKKTIAKKKTVAAAAEDERPAYESLIIGVAVEAVKARWPSHTLLTRGGRALVTAFMAAEVPSDVAAEAIRRATKRATKAPGSIAWFRLAVLEFWQENRPTAQIAVSATQPYPESAQKTHRVELATNATDPEFDRHAEFEQARYENAIAWSEDPANADAYQAIVRRFTAPHSSDALQLTWVAKGVSQNILEACIQAASFPDFEAWRAERTAAERRA